MREDRPIFECSNRRFLTVLGAVLTMTFSVFIAGAGTSVQAWGGGTFIANPPDNYNWGQSIVPAGLTNAVFVAGGWRHSLAVNADGTLIRWGDDSLGQTDFVPGTNYVAVACGWLHSLALQTDGTVAAAGDDQHGQTEVPLDLSNVVAVACGNYHSLALKSDGTVVAWGAGTTTNPGDAFNYGQSIVPANLSNVVAIAGGGWHSLALLSDGTVMGWGRNDFGQAAVPPGVTNVVAIGAGSAHDVALEANGTVISWGDDFYQQTNVPAGLSNVVAIAAGNWHNLALLGQGTVVAWGASGPNASTNNIAWGQNIVPTGLTNVDQVAAGVVNSFALIGNAPPSMHAAMTDPSFGTNGFSVSLLTLNGRVYRLEYKNSLADTNWIALPLQAGNGHLTQFTDPGATSSGARFYRVRRW